MKKKNREHTESLKSNKKKRIQCVEDCPHSLLLFEDQASQDMDLRVKKSKKKKKANGLDDSCIDVRCEINNETVKDHSKKKKKQKHHNNEEEQNNVLCCFVTQDNADNPQKMDTSLENVDYVSVDIAAKKKKRKKKNLSEGQDEVNELPGLYVFGNDCRSKKKRKQTSSCDTQESTDETCASSFLSYLEQNSTSSQKTEDEVMMLGSPTKRNTSVVPKKPHKNRKSSKKDKTDVTKISLVLDENPLDVAADVSKVASEGNNGCSEETMAPVRKIEMGSPSHSEQATLDSKRNLPESIAIENEEDQDVGCSEFAESEISVMLGNEESLETSMCSAMDLETAKRELEEFIPKVWTMSEKSVLQMVRRDLSRFKKFKEQGMPLKFGRFSEKENSQIRKNVEDFLSLTGIENAEQLLFTYRYPEEQKAISKLKIKYAFCMKIAEGIPRPWRLVYFRARKMFDPNNYKGRYSEEEKEKLKKYHAIHGNNWKKISELMSRSTLSVAMKYSQIKSQVNSGPWSEEETQNLIQAVQETVWKGTDLEEVDSFLQAENSAGCEKLYKNIPWTEIEAKVGTRYWRQCKEKWISIITKKMTKGRKIYRGTTCLQAKISLIKRLYEMKVEDANEVNWQELREIIGDVPEAYVQGKFYKLKATSVPSWHTKTFPEIIDYLYDETLPLLEKRLEKRQKRIYSRDWLHNSENDDSN